MRKISFWRYSAVNRQTLFCALACALLVFSMGCGSTNNLQSITLSVSNTDANAGTGFVLNPGSPVQMYTWGNYSSGKQKLLFGNNLAYQIASTPFGHAESGTFGDPNATPPQTVQLSADGQLTPITPPACSYVDVRRRPGPLRPFKRQVGILLRLPILGTLPRPALSMWLLRVSPLLPPTRPENAVRSRLIRSPAFDFLICGDGCMPAVPVSI